MGRVFRVMIICIIIASAMANAQLREKAEKIRAKSENTQSRKKEKRTPQEIKVNPTAAVDSTISQIWDGSNWAHVQYTKVSYSPDMKEQTGIMRKFVVDKWVPVTRTTINYNDNNDITRIYVELPDGDSWKPEEQELKTYKNGFITEELYQQYRNNEWVNFQRFTSKYNENNKETELLVELWNGEWVKSLRNTTRYNAEGNITLELAETWDGTQWVGMNKNEFTYDEVNKKSTSEFLVWTANEWVPVDRYEDLFGSHNENTETLYQEWDGSKWLNVMLKKYNYDENIIHMTDYTAQYWNADSSFWFDGEKAIYTYDDDILTETINQVKDGDEWVNSSKSTIADSEFEYMYLFQTWSGTDWVNASRLVYVYKQTTGVNDEVQPSVYNLEQNYPNPFNPVTTIKYTTGQAQHVTLNVYNMLGELAAVLVNTVQFNAAELSSGVYFYRIETGGISETKRMLLLK
jgi:hypothetical protein